MTDACALLDTTLIVHNRRPRAWQEWFAIMGVPAPRPPKAILSTAVRGSPVRPSARLGVALLPVALSQSWFATGALIRPCSGELETAERYYFVHRPRQPANPTSSPSESGSPRASRPPAPDVARAPSGALRPERVARLRRRGRSSAKWKRLRRRSPAVVIDDEIELLAGFGDPVQAQVESLTSLTVGVLDQVRP